MFQKSAGKSKFYLLNLKKKLPPLERRLMKQTGIMKTFATVKVLDPATLYRQAGISMKEIISIDSELEKVVKEAQGHIGNMPKDERKMAAKAFNSRIIQLEKRYLTPCKAAAERLKKLADKKAREKIPDIDAGVFTAWLDVTKFVVDMVNKKRKSY